MDEPSVTPEEANAAELLDQVMRGERFIWMPPGGYVATVVVPCLCPAVVSLSWGLVASVSNLGEKDTPQSAYHWVLGLAVIMIFGAIIPQTMVIRGYAIGRVLLVRYVRLLSAMGVLLATAVWLGRVQGPSFMIPACLLPLAITNVLVSSRSYLAVTSFFAIKRRYRLEAQARQREADALLAKGRSRRRS